MVLGCVNSVRWSNNGRYLASGGDDKLVMIWRISQYGGSSAVFGSDGQFTNIEQWRVANVLRGHSEGNNYMHITTLTEPFLGPS